MEVKKLQEKLENLQKQKTQLVELHHQVVGAIQILEQLIDEEEKDKDKDSTSVPSKKK